MFATGNARLGALAGFALAALAVGGLGACASAPHASPGPDPLSVISEVAVQRDADVTTVALVGLADPVFTAFRGQDPQRVVVDLSAVRADRVVETLAVYDGLVEEVSVAEYAAAGGEPATRVEVSLARAADFDVVPGADRLEIRVRPAASAESPWGDAGTADAAPAPVDAAAQGETPSTPASQLVGVDTQAAGEGMVVRLRTDGALTGVESFTLDAPARLVIDLPGLTNAWGVAQMDVEGPQVSRVRVGQHADKVRIVVDAADAASGFAARELVPMSDGLVVALGSGQELTWAVEDARAVATAMGADEAPTRVASAEVPDATDPQAQAEQAVPAAMDESAMEEVAMEENSMDQTAMDAPVMDEGMVETASLDERDDAPAAMDAAPMDESAPQASAPESPAPAESASSAVPVAEPVVEDAPASVAKVYGVQYEPEAMRDRVVVVSDRPVDYQVVSADAETLIVTMPNASIDPEASVRITGEAGAPVSLVTAFAQPEMDDPEVRVVINRASGLAPKVTQEGTMLVLDFARAGSVARTPPVMDGTVKNAVAAVPQAATAPAAVPASVPASVAPAGPAAVPAALDPSEPTEILREGGLLDGKQYVGRRISLDFKDVEIQDVLRLIADVSDLNVIAGDDVSGKITIRLVDVPWDQALDVILLTKGLGFVRVANVLRIAPAEMLKQEEEARLQERRAKEKLEDLVVKLQPVNYASVKDVSSMVKRLLTPRGSVDTDARTNTVIIKDIPSVIDEATALIKAIDTQTPQVMIEAKVVEANLDFSREIGSEWGFGAQPDEDQDDFTIDSAQVITEYDTGWPFDQANNVVVSNPISSLANGVLNLGAFILDDRFDITLRLAAAEANGEGKVISSPRIVTLDNREALIEQGVSIPFQTFENGDAQLEFIDAVLSLKVTPHITADRSIIMKVEVTRNAPDDSVSTPTGSPAIAKNQAKTETLIKDGQTLVIGGIYVIDKSDTEQRMPYLHKIPVLGMMFKSSTIRDIRKELLIFVSPRIVVGPEVAS